MIIPITKDSSSGFDVISVYKLTKFCFPDWWLERDIKEKDGETNVPIETLR